MSRKDKRKLWYIYTVVYYSSVRKSEILPFAIAWIDLDSIMLSEISHLEKDKYFYSSIPGIIK